MKKTSTAKRLKVTDISKNTDQLTTVKNEDLMKLPDDPNNPLEEKEWTPLSESVKQNIEASLDDTVVLNIPKPKTKEDEDELVRKFLSGLAKLFTPENNWTFLEPLLLSMDHCAKCQTCSDACHIFEASGGNELYRPIYRSEILRRIYFKYLKPGGKFYGKWIHGDIDLNWKTVSRLAELSYRCNLCRRCAQTCPIGVDNGLITREIRKIFSQELGIASKELHENGSVLQLKVGSSTGMNSLVVKDNVEFIDEEMSDLTGLQVETPWDVQGADVLLVHNAGEFLAWPENPGAFAIILQSAGVNWTLSSEAPAYDSINYGVFYDDMMFAKTVIRHAKIAKKLGVKKIVFGECGHAHKAWTVIADRILTGDLNVPRENAMTFLESIMDKLEFDPSRNNFPVTLHDPCNLVRLMGVVQPQRRILKKIAPKFREMTPHGVHNICCGGGSGFAIMSGNNFSDWRFKVSGRKKIEQVLNAFKDDLDSDEYKYICAPCSNCKGQFRDIIAYYDLFEKYKIYYGGLVELIVNCMTNVKPGFIEWEWH